MTGVFGGQSVSFVNARVVTPGPVVSSIRFASRVLSVGTAPARGDVVIDLDGAVVLPGLVNGHDHLELNHYGRVGDLGPYRNASEWIDEIRPRLRTDPVILAGRAHPLASRLFIGELKNLLSGATTVVHHNPRYAELNGTYPCALPLILSGAIGSELRRPLGITIVGGLLMSQALTLFTTPVVYVYLDRLRLALRGSADEPLPQTTPPGSPRPSPAH